MSREIKRGDMYYAELKLGVGSEQHGRRPVLILQNDIGNRYSSTTIAAIVTTSRTKAKLPTHCPIRAQQGLLRDSLVLLEQLRTIDKTRLREYLGTLDAETMAVVDECLAISIGLSDNLK